MIRSMLMLSLAVVAGCAASPSTSTTDGPASIEGTIVSIDTQPWTYDGNAMVVIDTAQGNQIAVQLPARWNLCQAAPVNVEALRVGQRARATGALGPEKELVVCADVAHELVPID